MGTASACSLLILFLLLLCSNGETRLDPPNNNVLRLPTMDMEHDHHHHHPVTDPSMKRFFTLNDLKPGNIMELYFPKKTPDSTVKFLPRQEAESIPFSLHHLPLLLRRFSFPPESPQAKAMEATLTQCLVIKPIIGETKFCPTSIDSMLDFARAIFNGPDFQILTTRFIKDSGTLFQNYTVTSDPRVIPAAKMMACHTMPYPYGVYYCHSQKSENRVLRVSLVGDSGDEVDAVAVCHMDTSQWSPTHASFNVLGFKPGSSHVCHFFPSDNLVIVPKLIN